MKIFLRDLTSITVRNERRVRFSVTYAEDDGEPVATEIGWTVDANRVIRGPAVRSQWGKYYPVVEMSDKWLQRITVAVEKLKFTAKVLGPRVEEIDMSGNETSDEEIEA